MSSRGGKRGVNTGRELPEVKEKDWEMVDIKVEALDEQLDSAAATIDDVKPDANELQQEIVRQQLAKRQKKQQQQQIIPTTSSPSGWNTAEPKQLLIFGDLTCLTQLNGSSGGSVVLQCDSLNSSAVSGGVKVVTTAATHSAVVAPHFCPSATAMSTAAPHATAGTGTMQTTTKTTATTTSTTSPAILKFLDESFVRDRFDLQESDIDEEGYSDIDFYDDDDELVEDDESDFYDPTWSDQPTAPRMVHDFKTKSVDVGLEGRPKFRNPIFYFDMLLGGRREFFELLQTGSNARAQELLQSSSASVGQAYFKRISGEEMQVFIGLCLQMSAMRLPHVADYWSEQASHYGFQGFSEKMSMNRFQMLMRVLNFEKLSQNELFEQAAAEEEKEEEEDCSKKAAFAELSPLLHHFNRRMQQIYKCGQRVILNEPLMFWKGNLSWALELSEKFRCDAVSLHFLTERTGLLLKIVADVESIERKQHVRNSKLLAKQRVELAKDLLKEKLGKGHTVYTSKYYGSFGLAYELASHSTYCTGLLDNKRYGNCKQLIMTKLQKPLFAMKYAATIDKPSIMMGKWKRREKCVYFYSSDCLAIYCQETSAPNSDMRIKIIKELDWQLRPPANIREHMLRYQIGLERNEIKWDKQLGIYVLNLILLNAYILYTTHAQFGHAQNKELAKLKSYAEFRQYIVRSLLRENEAATKVSVPDKSQKACGAGRSGNDGDDNYNYELAQHALHRSAATPTAAYKLLAIEHMPMVIPRRKGKVLKKKCRICCKGGMLTFSKLCCEVCPGQPGLCETPCFKIWHDQLKKSVEAGEQIKMRTFGKSGEKTIYF